VRFWDTSAIVPLLIDEPLSASLREFARKDSMIVVWWGTRIECVSALSRRVRDGELDALASQAARRVLATLSESWSEILPGDPLRARAERLLAVHPLRTLDALQVAAALTWCRGDTTAHTVVCLDQRLRDALQREGFRLLPD